MSPIKLASKSQKRLPKALFVVGPTASGKTDLALKIAERFHGEIVNADARQIYREIEIGTGRPSGVHKGLGKQRAYIHRGVPHYLMGFLPPSESYSAAEWRDGALNAIEGITKRKHLPIVVGGTGLYVASLVDNLIFPNVEPHPAFRKTYEAKSLDELVAMLLILDPGSREIVDLRNKRRVIRALEVATFTGKKFSELRAKGDPVVDALQIGIRWTPEELRERISRTVDNMFERGLVREVQEILKDGVNERSPALSAIGYRVVVDHLKGKMTLEDAVKQFKQLTWLYAKRQMTWFKKDQRIHLVTSDTEAIQLVGEWVMKNGT